MLQSPINENMNTGNIEIFAKRVADVLASRQKNISHKTLDFIENLIKSEMPVNFKDIEDDHVYKVSEVTKAKPAVKPPKGKDTDSGPSTKAKTPTEKRVGPPKSSKYTQHDMLDADVYKKITVKELKEYCTDLGLKKAGTKKQLVDRLDEYYVDDQSVNEEKPIFSATTDEDEPESKPEKKKKKKKLQKKTMNVLIQHTDDSDVSDDISFD